MPKAKSHKKKQGKDKLINDFILGFNGVIVVLLFIIFFVSLIIVKNQRNFLDFPLPPHVPLNIAEIKKNPPRITPYPTVSITPTPVPLTGYCLWVPVLTYHHIQPEAVAKQLGQTSLTVDNGIFDQQMAYLMARGYTPIWANELINALISHSGLPGKPVVVSMDDGYADNYIYALPVLEKYHIKANLMLASGLVDSNPDMLTWDMVNAMKSSGLYYFTNHTWSHWPISQGPQSKIDLEIDTAQSEIQQHTGQTVNVFTYPYGSFNNNAITTLQSKGYIGAFSTIPGAYQCDSFIMTLHRYRVGNASLSYYGL